jgi:serine protease Do
MAPTLAPPQAPAALGHELAATVAALRGVTVVVRTRGAGVGAGVVWDARGLIITNAHVARGDELTVQFSDGRSAPARVVARDGQRDLAALELEPPGALAAAVLRAPPGLRVGELVIAVGHPHGHAGAMTVGIIQASDDGNGSEPRWVRADVRLAPGYSGGPLADVAGRVVGINTLIYGGLALAVPVAAVEAWLRAARHAPRRDRPRARGRRRAAGGANAARPGSPTRSQS